MATLLTDIGQRVRARRQARAMTIKELAERAGLSARFLIDLEKGRGNIAVGRLASVADALGEPLVSFFVPAPVAGIVAQLTQLDAAGLMEVERSLAARDEVSAPQLVALLGVRGAGKSTIGRQVAERLELDFVELDGRIEAAAGLSLAEIFAIHGEPYYRQVEFDVLRELVGEGRGAVVATGGSLVAHEESWGVLRAHARTVWLKAAAQDHWDRVIAQGDHRPMDRNPQAFAQLQALMRSREPLYAQADIVVDTSLKGADQVASEVLGAL